MQYCSVVQNGDGAISSNVTDFQSLFLEVLFPSSIYKIKYLRGKMEVSLTCPYNHGLFWVVVFCSKSMTAPLDLMAQLITYSGGKVAL